MDTSLPDLGEVEVTLDRHTVVALFDGGLGHVQAVECTAFRVNRGLGRVQIFRDLSGVERPAAEGHDGARIAGNRDHQPVPEPVDQPAAVPFEDESRLPLHLAGDPLLREERRQRPAVGRGIAVPEHLLCFG